MSPVRMSRFEAAMQLVLRFYEAINRADLERAEGCLDTSCVLEDYAPAPDGSVISGKEAIAALWRTRLSESSGLQLDIEEIYGLGNRCFARWVRTDTDHDGTTKRIRGADIFEVKDGAIREIFSYSKAGQSSD